MSSNIQPDISKQNKNTNKSICNIEPDIKASITFNQILKK